jgi:hypothetical protein
MVRWVLFAVLGFGCTDASPSDSPGSDETTSTSSGTGGGSTGTSGASGGATTTGGAGMGTGASAGGASAGGASGGHAGTIAMGGAGSSMPGGPGCGLASAAFCDKFDAVSAKRGREGDLDPVKWSVSRGEPQLPTGNGVALGIPPASVPNCRTGLPATVYPEDDSIVCDPTADIKSNHLLVAVGAQNYGQNSYRIRQPFDFAGRTGKIVFDAQGYVLNQLLGWISVEVTEDPAPIPNYSIGAPTTTNQEGGAVPRNALEVQFATQCAGAVPPKFFVSMIDVLKEYQDTVSMPPNNPTCITGLEGKLNHFEIAVSQTRVDVFVSPVSSDGVTFEPAKMVYGVDVNLPFSRGYVQLTTHNHATLKYSHNGDYGTTHVYDAWLSRWDNVGFDGPVLANTREYEIADALIPGMNSWNVSGPVMSIAYKVADESKGPSSKLIFHGVSLAGVDTARLAVGSWYDLSGGMLAQYNLKYRLNGKAWHDRKLTATEIAVLTNTHAQGAIGQMLDVPPSDLVEGDNTLEFVTVGVPQGYPPAVSSIDLILTTK